MTSGGTPKTGTRAQAGPIAKTFTAIKKTKGIKRA